MPQRTRTALHNLFKKMKKIISLCVLVFLLASCSEEPKESNDLPVRLLIHIIDNYENNKQFNTPANPPEYIIINSARDIANLPKGTLAAASEYEYSKIDFAKYTLIVVTSVIYCQPFIEEDDWIWAGANFDLTKDHNLDIRYNDCSVFETGLYSYKCKIQCGVITLKIPSDTKLRITESMTSNNKQ